MNKELLDILCCPATRQPLREAGPAEIALANSKLPAPISEALIREDGQVLYPISGGIPLLLEAEAISL